MIHSVLGICIVVSLLATFLGLMVAWLDISNNPYNYRIPPYEAYLSKTAMTLFEETEQFRKRGQRTLLAIKLLVVFVLWVIAIFMVLVGQLVF